MQHPDSAADSSLAHIRYAIRRVRRKVPQAKILLGCWMVNGDTSTVINSVKADAIATTPRDATKLCLEAAGEADYEALPLPTESERLLSNGINASHCPVPMTPAGPTAT